MSDETQSGPIMDGSTDATDRERRAGLAEQVHHDHQGEAAGSADEDLQVRTAQSGTDGADSD